MGKIRSRFAKRAATMHRSGKMLKEISEKVFAKPVLIKRREMIDETYISCSKETTLQAASKISNLVSEQEFGRFEHFEDESEVDSVCDESVFQVIDRKQKHVALDLRKNILCFW